MTDKPENPPAFPQQIRPIVRITDNVVEYGEPALTGGLSMRDYFAAAALSGIQPEFRSAPGTIIAQDYEELAKYAYRLADAMLDARRKP